MASSFFSGTKQNSRLHRHEIHIGGLELGVAQESGLDLHADPVQTGLIRVGAQQASEEESVRTFELDEGQHEGRLGQKFLGSKVAHGKGVDAAFLRQLHP